MKQPPLIPRPKRKSPLTQLDPESEALIGRFREVRLHTRAHPRSVAREVSQLRSVIRACVSAGGPITLENLFSDPHKVACALREPPKLIARSTGHARLIAVQRFLEVASVWWGRRPAEELAKLDILLPARRTERWHQTGIVVAGSKNRQRQRGPTLEEADLRRIIGCAGTGSGLHALRDRALIALHCFSGVRPEEIVALQWEDILHPSAANGIAGPVAVVSRDGKLRNIPIVAQASVPLALYAQACGAELHLLVGPIFPKRPSHPHPISYSSARSLLRAACQRAGLPEVEANELRAAYGHWLSRQGLSDHEVMMALGLSRVRSVDQLLARHRALNAQRHVRELIAD